MIGAPPPLPGKKPPEPEKKKPRSKPLIIKGGKDKAKQKPKTAKPTLNTSEDKQEDPGLTLIAPGTFLGQRVVYAPSTKKTYHCLCVCGKYETVSITELMKKKRCAHRGSDQDFSINTRAARSYTTLLKTQGVAGEFLDFSAFVKHRETLSLSESFIALNASKPWRLDNIIKVFNRSAPTVKEVRAVTLTNPGTREETNALEYAVKHKLDLNKLIRHAATHKGDDVKIRAYVLKKVKGLY
ncbi:hypothetical protein NVP1215B_027 [Vibrio phage 1.215.B._10N.222.54.F7]|nr:hypothetical protein NVP1215A_027 [Vibrio phage 1.215.A._10N.222.54.F7]AUR96050.1 hypothetical protein NVP1215B_027 [Vibrio phage 1.215.B._10N.222.54.F7]